MSDYGSYTVRNELARLEQENILLNQRIEKLRGGIAQAEHQDRTCGAVGTANLLKEAIKADNELAKGGGE